MNKDKLLKYIQAEKEKVYNNDNFYSDYIDAPAISVEEVFKILAEIEKLIKE